GGLVSLAFKRRDADLVAGLFSLVAFVLAIIVSLKAGFRERTFAFGSLPWLGIQDVFGFRLDPLAIIMLLVTTFIGVFVVIYSSFYLSEGNKEHPTTNGKGRYYFWLLFFLGAMIGVSISPNFFQFFIFFELTTICSFALIDFYETPRALRAGFVALITTSLGSLCFLAGLAILAVYSRSFDFDAVRFLSPSLKATFFILLWISALAKGAQVPFQIWLPQAMEAPTPISAYLHAASMVKVGVFLIARMVTTPYAHYPESLGVLVSLWALFSMLFALLAFLGADDIKKLLAYSTILHIGYILLGTSLGLMGAPLALQGGILHIINHSVAKGLLFLCAGVVTYITGTRRISQLGGLAPKMPVVAETFTIGTLAIAGVPPFACFFSKFYIILGAISLHNWLGTSAAVFTILESTVSLAWFIMVTHRIFMGEEKEPAKEVDPVPFYINALLLLLVIFTVIAPLLGLYIVKVFEVIK
ncbi:MAG: hydrogenase 4 subunit D, partial [bacterium]